MVDHLYKATTGCIIKITLVSLAFDDRVAFFLYAGMINGMTSVLK